MATTLLVLAPMVRGQDRRPGVWTETPQLVAEGGCAASVHIPLSKKIETIFQLIQGKPLLHQSHFKLVPHICTAASLILSFVLFQQALPVTHCPGVARKG